MTKIEGGEVNELSERATELAIIVEERCCDGDDYVFIGSEAAKLIEQALLAERQRALIEAADICDRYSGEKWKGYKTGNGSDRGNLNAEGQSDGASHCATLILRVVKELDKLATPRGGE